MDKEKKEIFNEELNQLESEFNELTQELKEYGNNCYAEENWNRRVEVVRRINIIKDLLK